MAEKRDKGQQQQPKRDRTSHDNCSDSSRAQVPGGGNKESVINTAPPPPRKPKGNDGNNG